MSNSRKRITPQWISPLAWPGQHPTNERITPAATYVETQEANYLDEYHLLCHIEGRVLELANGIHHYLHRVVPEENEQLFKEDMEYNIQKKQRILNLLGSVTSFHEILDLDINNEEEEESEEINEAGAEVEEEQETDDHRMVVMNVISQILDIVENELQNPPL